MKIIVIATLLGLLALSAFAASNHYFFTGKVVEVSDRSITVANRVLPFAQKVAVVVHERSASGNFEEKKSRISYVTPGTPVIVRVEGAMVNQIIIEEWKR